MAKSLMWSFSKVGALLVALLLVFSSVGNTACITVKNRSGVEIDTPSGGVEKKRPTSGLPADWNPSKITGISTYLTSASNVFTASNFTTPATDGQGVGGWKDTVGSFNFVSGGADPTLQVGEWAGASGAKNEIVFGTSHFLINSSGQIGANGQPISIAVIAQSADDQGLTDICRITRDAGTVLLSYTGNGGSISFHDGNGCYTGNFTFDSTKAHSYVVTYDGSSVNIYFDKTKVTASSGGDCSLTGNYSVLGAQSLFDSPFGGSKINMFEVAVYNNKVLTDKDASNIADYVSDNY